MSTKVLLKKSSVLGKIPLTTDLSYGELALNYADGKLYFKDSSNNIQSFNSNVQLSLNDLTDVDTSTTAPNIGQVLKWNGTNWVPGNDETVGGTGTDADTLDGFDSSYFLNYNNLLNKPTIPTLTSQLTNDSGYLTSYTETDPIYTASSWYTTTNNSSNWNTAYGWGNHASVGYLTSVSWNDVSGKPTFATVATSGSYTDLSNTPSLFSGDYNDLSNKPTLFSGSYNDLTDKPFIPSKTSDITNDSGYLIALDLIGYVTTSQLSSELANKQDTLVSGNNIKTINGQSILGSGDIVITSSTSSVTYSSSSDFGQFIVGGGSNSGYIRIEGAFNGSGSDPIASQALQTYLASLTVGDHLEVTFVDNAAITHKATISTTASSVDNLPTKYDIYFDIIFGSLPFEYFSGSNSLSITPLLSKGVPAMGGGSESDPVYAASSWYTTTNNSSNWDTAYGWGDHSTAGYLTSLSTIDWSKIVNEPALFSGDYNDLTNKPTIPTVPTLVSAFTNDANYVNTTQLATKQATLVSGTNIKTINGTSILGSGNISISGGSGGITLTDLSVNTVAGPGPGSLSYDNTTGIFSYTPADLSTRQETLISGTNIKTINGTSILGSGDIVISGGGGSLYTNTTSTTDTSANQVVDTFALVDYRTVKYMIQATSATEVHSTEVTIMHNDVNAFMTEYNVMYSGTGKLFTASSDVSGTNARLLVTPLVSGLTIDVTRISLVTRAFTGGGFAWPTDLETQTQSEIDLQTQSYSDKDLN